MVRIVVDLALPAHVLVLLRPGAFGTVGQRPEPDGEIVVADHAHRCADRLGDRGGQRTPEQGLHIDALRHIDVDRFERGVTAAPGDQLHLDLPVRRLVPEREHPAPGSGSVNRGRPLLLAVDDQADQGRRMTGREVVDPGPDVLQAHDRPCSVELQVQIAGPDLDRRSRSVGSCLRRLCAGRGQDAGRQHHQGHGTGRAPTPLGPPARGLRSDYACGEPHDVSPVALDGNCCTGRCAGHPFVAPPVRPRTNCFWKAR